MNWLLIAGKQDPSLEKQLVAAASSSLQKNKFQNHSMQYLTNLDRSISFADSDRAVSPVLLEKIRALCQFWDVGPTVGPISSHRKYVGPLIVKSKRLLFSVLKVLLKPTFEKQRNFNAQLIETLVELSKRK